MFKKYWKKVWFFIFLIGIAFWNLVFAQEFDVTNYDIKANIRIDGTIDINEKIDVNFYKYMHGIERFFPKYYNVEDLEFQILYNNISVNGDTYKNFNEYSEVYTRIWDSDKTIIWEHEYNIEYSTYWLIRNFSWMWYSELYWNAVWYDWWNNINKVQIQITLPKPYTWFTNDDFLISAWYSVWTTADKFDWEITRDENNIYIAYDKTLSPYRGITLAVKFPNNYFEYDHEKQASLFVWYTRDYKINNYKLYWNVSKTWNITFESNIELEVLHEDAIVEWIIPYRYQIDRENYLTILNDITMNWKKIETKKNEFESTSASYKWFYILWDYSNNNIITWTYSIFWFVRPFTGEFEDWAYRLYLPLPVFELTQSDLKDFELKLDLPWGCTKNIYQEDVSVQIWWNTISLNEYNEKYWRIWCRDETFMMTYTWTDEIGYIWLYINFVKWTFDLDEDLLEALSVLWDWKFYYKNKLNIPSILFLFWMLIFWWWFRNLMAKRYKNNIKNDKYIIQYDAPKWVDSPEAGVLVDDEVNPKDITSLIYRWASNKYIEICSEDINNKKFYLKKLKDLPQDTKEYQKNLFKKLFSNRKIFYFSKNKSSFSTYLTQTEKELNNYIDWENWYTSKISNVKLHAYSFKSWTKSRIFWMVILRCLAYYFTVTRINETLNFVWSWMVPVFRIWLIWIIYSYKWKEKEQWTKKWIELRSHCLWYKAFLDKVDKKRIEELTKQDPLFVEKSLPFAVVFWIETEFIKKITPEMLSWYDGDLDSLLSSVSYISSFSRSSSYYSYGGSSSSSYHYSSSSWHSWGSSFSGGWFSSWGWGGWGWWRWW